MPGSIGASDLTITGTLQHLIGLSLPQAGFVTLVARFVQLWFGVLVGAVVAWAARSLWLISRPLPSPALLESTVSPAVTNRRTLVD